MRSKQINTYKIIRIVPVPRKHSVSVLLLAVLECLTLPCLVTLLWLYNLERTKKDLAFTVMVGMLVSPPKSRLNLTLNPTV